MIGKAPAETHQLIKYDLFCGEITKKSVALQQEMRQADEEGKTMNGFVMKKAKKKEKSPNTIGEELLLCALLRPA